MTTEKQTELNTKQEQQEPTQIKTLICDVAEADKLKSRRESLKGGKK